MSLIWRSGAILTAIGVATGAFGAHSLKQLKPPVAAPGLASWSTASSYMIYNGLALLAISQHPRFGRRGGSWAPALIGTGAALFSGSIFALVLLNRNGPIQGAWKVLGPTTPVGGSLMIVG